MAVPQNILNSKVSTVSNNEIYNNIFSAISKDVHSFREGNLKHYLLQ